MRIALKIDIDTYRGIAGGGQRLATYLQAQGIPASLFVSLGPDNSGWAATRVFRHRGFFQKMRRTSAIALYGWRTALSGTLWPARPMGTSFINLFRQWREMGFDVSPHGFDHILWHDQAAEWTADRARQEWAKIAAMYRHIFGEVPASFAAPGWQAGAGVWEALDEANLLYHSDTRGDAPYWPEANGKRFKTLEIPTTMPTWDEMLAWPAIERGQLVDETWKTLRADRLNVWTIHAEFEGSNYFPEFETFVKQSRERRVEWVSLSHVAKESAAQTASASIYQGTRPGRAGTVTCQTVSPA